jgi:hypothetical protein
MFDELWIDAKNRVWTRGLPDDGPADDWKPYLMSGEIRLREDSGNREYAALADDGQVTAIRPGWQEAWQSQVTAPGSPSQHALVFARLLGDGDSPHDQAVWMKASGLPECRVADASWVISTAGHLVLAVDPDAGHDGWEKVNGLNPEPVHGWVFLTDPSGIRPDQAMRFVSGRRQWVVPVELGGTASTPRTMAGLGFRVHGDDQRDMALAAACPVLPTDYSDYGGDAVRWEHDTDRDADCSSGCRWFAPLHNDTTDSADCDWGVCVNACSPRQGLLTWEHQAGRACFEGTDETG